MAWNGMACDAPNNVMLMRNDHHGNASDSLVAMLASCPRPPPRIGGPCIMPGMEDPRVGGSKRSFYSMFETSDDTGDGEIADDGSLHVEKKRRLTVEQVRSLEMSFEVENRLEPERKMQLAQELGLQPRQVAVWFQNRRARWKTKQLERDYDILKGAYDALLEENKKLKSEVNRLMKVNGGDEQPEDIVKKEVVEEEELEEDPIASCLKPSPSPEHALELSDELMSSLDTHGDVSSKSKSLTKEESPVSDGYHSEVLDTADSPASDRKPKKEILTQAELPAMITISAVLNEEDDSAAFLQPVKDEPFTSECFSQIDYKLDDQLLEEEPYPEPLFGPEEQNGSWPWWDLHVFDANCGKG